MNKGRNCKKVAAALMALTMTAGMVPANICSFISVTANAEEVELIVPADEVVTDDETTAEEVVAVDYSALTEGEYIIDGDVTVESVITVSGVVDLTLNSGATLTAVQGIVIEEGAVLNVYGEGTLVATGAPNEGTNQFGHNAIKGTINIYGGTIDATASDSATGWGYDWWLRGNGGVPGVAAIDGDITVYGGKVIAIGLMAVPLGGLPVAVNISETDLTDAPAFAGGVLRGSPFLMILSAAVSGWRPGQTAEVDYKDVHARGIITERRVEADTASGMWKSEMIVELI